MNDKSIDTLDLEVGDDLLVELDGVPTFLHYEGPGHRFQTDSLGVFRSSRGGFVLLTTEQIRQLEGAT